MTPLRYIGLGLAVVASIGAAVVSCREKTSTYVLTYCNRFFDVVCHLFNPAAPRSMRDRRDMLAGFAFDMKNRNLRMAHFAA